MDPATFDVDTKDPGAVRTHVANIYRDLFPGAPLQFIENAFDWTSDAFNGRYADFQPVDAKYHDLETPAASKNDRFLLQGLSRHYR